MRATAANRKTGNRGFTWSRAAFHAAAERSGASSKSDRAAPNLDLVSRPSVEETSVPLPSRWGVLPSQEASRPSRSLPQPRRARLVVHPEHGAGIEVSFVTGRGYIVEAVASEPGQPGLSVGDLIVAVGGRTLALDSEEDADEALALELADGVELCIADSTEELPNHTQAPELDFDTSRMTYQQSPGGQNESKRGITLEVEEIPTVDLLGLSGDGTEFAAGVSDKNHHVDTKKENTMAIQSTATADNGSWASWVQWPWLGGCEPHSEFSTSTAPASVDCQAKHAGKFAIDEIATNEGHDLQSSYVLAAADAPECGAQNGEKGQDDEEQEDEEEEEEVVLQHRRSPADVDANRSTRLHASNALRSDQSECGDEAESTLEKARLEAQHEARLEERSRFDEEALLSRLDVDHQIDEDFVDADVECNGKTSEKLDSIPPLPSLLFDPQAIGNGVVDPWSIQTMPLEVSTTSAAWVQAPVLSGATAVDVEEGSTGALLLGDLEGSSQQSAQHVGVLAVAVPQQRSSRVSTLSGVHNATSSRCVGVGRFDLGGMCVDAVGGDLAPVHCKVNELWDWLCELSLQEYYALASIWCSEMGAVSLEEIAENIQDFAESVRLKPIERQRVQKWAAQVLHRAAEPETRRGPRGSPAGHEEALALALPSLSAPAASSRAAPSTSSSRPPAPEGPAVYAARSVRLAMDSQGNTGLELRWDEEWGVLVESVDPLPGQPGLGVGDYIVAIDGCSLRHRSHEECDTIFAERLQDDALLSVVTPAGSDVQRSSEFPAKQRGSDVQRSSEDPFGVGRGLGTGWARGARSLPQAQPQRGQPLAPNWQFARGRGRRGGYDANRMWTRFRGPPW